MSLESRILSLDQPTIKLDQMSTRDTETGATGVVDISENKRRKKGDLYPFVMINKHTLTADELTHFAISETDFLPSLEFSMLMSNGIFLSNHYPKDGDIVSVYIRSKRKKIKPIRMDFDILSIVSSPSPQSHGDSNVFMFVCVLRVPGLYSEYCKAFKDKTSFETVRTVAKELKLGFATNMTSTSDKMTWVCPFISYMQFITDTTRHAYTSEDSFIAAFVDKYYHLNFVNIRQQLNDDKDVEKSIEVHSARLDHMRGDEDMQEDESLNLVLGNHTSLQKTSLFIEGYTLRSSAGQVMLENGYRKSAQFYDVHLSGPFKNRYQSHVVEAPASPDGYTSNKGRGSEDISSKLSTFKWLGTQSSNTIGNSHKNYKYSAVLNWQNQRELDKMHLEVVLSQCGFNLRRGMRIPVVIVNDGDPHRVSSTKSNGEEPEMKITLDRFLSGFYIVLAMKTIFYPQDGVFRQIVQLGRRDWPTPVNYDKTTDLTES